MNDSSTGKVVLFDDFTRKAIDTTNQWTSNADGGGTAFAINAQANGVVRGTGDGTDGDITSLLGTVIFKATAGGPLIFEARVKPVTSVADGETFIGLTDATTDENPIQVSTTDVQTDAATDAVGFTYTGAGTANWKAVAVKADSSRTPVACNQPYTTDAGVSSRVTTPVVGTYMTFKIVVNEDGDADFYINGSYQARIDSAVTAGTLLIPAVVQEEGGTARSTDVDFIRVESGRV